MGKWRKMIFAIHFDGTGTVEVVKDHKLQNLVRRAKLAGSAMLEWPPPEPCRPITAGKRWP